MGGNIGLFVCMMCISFVDHSKYFCIERQISFDGVTYANNQNKNTILCNMDVGQNGRPRGPQMLV